MKGFLEWNDNLSILPCTRLNSSLYHFCYLWFYMKFLIMFHILCVESIYFSFLFTYSNYRTSSLHIIKDNFLDLIFASERWANLIIFSFYIQKCAAKSSCDRTKGLILRITLLSLVFHYLINVPWTIHDSKMPEH